MEKKDVKLLITGAIALFLACFLGIITIALFIIKLGNKAIEYAGFRRLIKTTVSFWDKDREGLS